MKNKIVVFCLLLSIAHSNYSMEKPYIPDSWEELYEEPCAEQQKTINPKVKKLILTICQKNINKIEPILAYFNRLPLKNKSDTISEASYKKEVNFLQEFQKKINAQRNDYLDEEFGDSTTVCILATLGQIKSGKIRCSHNAVTDLKNMLSQDVQKMIQRTDAQNNLKNKKQKKLKTSARQSQATNISDFKVKTTNNDKNVNALNQQVKSVIPTSSWAEKFATQEIKEFTPTKSTPLTIKTALQAKVFVPSSTTFKN